MLVPRPTGWARAAVLAPALVVGACAVAATAHGGFEVAVASQVPDGIAWTYPVSADGLALVAYSSTHRLHGAARRYAWTVVVAAAGLSGLAQAVYLAIGPGLVAPPAMRFGVGYWPAIAGAVAAHLVFLLAHRQPVRRMQPVTVAELVATRPPAEPPAVAPAPKTEDIVVVSDDLDTARRARAAEKKREQRAAARRRASRDG